MQQQHAKRGTYLSALQNFFLNPVQGKTCLGSNWNGLRKFKCLSVGPQDIHMSVMKYINTYIQNSDKFTHTHAHTHTHTHTLAHTQAYMNGQAHPQNTQKISECPTYNGHTLCPLEIPVLFNFKDISPVSSKKLELWGHPEILSLKMSVL